MFPETRKELLKEIESKFQLALVMSIFFPSFLQVFSSMAGNLEVANRLFIQLSGFVSFYLFAWICFQFAKGNKKVANFWLNILNWILVISIFSFVIPLFVTAASLSQTEPSTSSWQPAFWLLLYKISLWGIVLGGVVTALVVGFYTLQVMAQSYDSKKENN